MYLQPSLLFSASLGLAALAFTAMGQDSVASDLLVAAMAGAIVGLGSRLWMAMLGLALAAWAATHPLSISFASWAVSLSLLALACVADRLPTERPATRRLAALPLLISIGLVLQAAGPSGPVQWALGVVSAGLAFYAGYAAAALLSGRSATAFRSSSGQADRIAHHLLLGRIAPGLSYELSQSLNVITMANGNIAYIVDQLDISAEERTQLNARIARIGVHSDVAAKLLNILRWFGKEGGRDKGLITVGSALERAIAAVQPAARSAGVTVDLRGDAIDFPASARHGMIEMIGVAALLDILAVMKESEPEAAPGRVVLDASHDGGEVVVSLLCERMPREEMRRSEIDRTTLQFADDLARECGGKMEHIRRRNDPVQLTIRLKRGAI